MANEIARTLRKRMTPQEVKLWVNLRGLKVEGFHFRRQCPIGPYIVDFAEKSHGLVIEVDGSQHGIGEHMERDRLLFALSGMVQLAIGNVLIYMAMARIPAAQSGLLGILNTGFAPLWVLACLGEVPSTSALIGDGIVFASAVALFLWTLLAGRKLTVAET